MPDLQLADFALMPGPLLNSLWLFNYIKLKQFSNFDLFITKFYPQCSKMVEGFEN